MIKITETSWSGVCNVQLLKNNKSKYPYCAVEIEMQSRDICCLLFYSNWTLHSTPIQLVSVLFIVVLRRAERYYRFSDVSRYFVIKYRDSMPVHYCH